MHCLQDLGSEGGGKLSVIKVSGHHQLDRDCHIAPSVTLL
jgi:hypothetical protein